MKVIARITLILALGLGALTAAAVSVQAKPPESHSPAGAPWIRLAGPSIGSIRVQTPGQIERYAKFEIAFDITATSATNPYFPYDPEAPTGVEPGTGINVDAYLLPPSQTGWTNAKTLPCFYYQPVQELGAGAGAGLVPTGNAEWRCRFTPEMIGTWQYKVRAQDGSGTAESAVQQFSVVSSNRKGFVKVSATDPRFFEFSDGTPFVAPLINVEEGNPFNGLANLTQNIQRMGESGIRFIRWFPTGEGANYSVILYADDLTMSWQFGAAGSAIDDVDTAAGKLISFKPYYYSGQDIPALPGARYRLTFRAKITGEQVLRADIAGKQLDVCSATSTYHGRNGQTCGYKQEGWNDYVLDYVNSGNLSSLPVYMRGLYVNADAPSPYNSAQTGRIRIHSMKLQRDETGNNGWGPNLLTRSDPETYEYVDQISAARLDEIFRLSEEYGVYHKLTLFHKNDQVLNRFLPDGTITSDWDSYDTVFYSAPGLAARWLENAYVRYFVARWSYSPALHSLELANENHLTQESYDAGFAVAELVRNTSPRRILMTNSFWGWLVDPFFNDPVRKYLIDYADKHWYANETGSGTTEYPGEIISAQYKDSAAYERECAARFKDYERWFSLNEPIVRGEGGVAESGTEPQHPDIQTDPSGTYYHKLLWAHVGTLGYSCNGEWYPRLFVANSSTGFPNNTANLAAIYAAYERFTKGEPLSNGRYREIGTDLTGTAQILLANTSGSLRAWGSQDALTGRTLLWIDNANHTWWNVVSKVSIPQAGGNLTIQGLPKGAYTADWWNTTTGSIARSETYTVGDDGRLAFSVSNLATDLAVKFVNTTASNPTSVSIPLLKGWNLVASPLVPVDPAPGAVFAPIAGQFTSVYTYNACDTTDPWKRYDPSAPSFANDLTAITVEQGFWIQTNTDTTLTITGTAPTAVSNPLCSGPNLIGYPSSSAVALPDALASIAGSYTRVYAYDPSDATDPWKSFDPSAPAFVNDLTSLAPGRGYWVQMSQAALLDLDPERP